MRDKQLAKYEAHKARGFAAQDTLAATQLGIETSGGLSDSIDAFHDRIMFANQKLPNKGRHRNKIVPYETELVSHYQLRDNYSVQSSVNREQRPFRSQQPYFTNDLWSNHSITDLSIFKAFFGYLIQNS